MKPLRFAVTPGEPAGIGPDLCLLLAADVQPHPLIAITSRDLLAERATQLGLAVNLLPAVRLDRLLVPARPTTVNVFGSVFSSGASTRCWLPVRRPDSSAT